MLWNAKCTLRKLSFHGRRNSPLFSWNFTDILGGKLCICEGRALKLELSGIFRYSLFHLGVRVWVYTLMCCRREKYLKYWKIFLVSILLAPPSPVPEREMISHKVKQEPGPGLGPCSEALGRLSRTGERPRVAALAALAGCEVCVGNSGSSVCWDRAEHWAPDCQSDCDCPLVPLLGLPFRVTKGNCVMSARNTGTWEWIGFSEQ